MLRARTASFVAALAMLALPAASLAQSAGDDQYSDPLAGNNGGGNTSGHVTNTSGGGGSGGSGGGTTSSGTPSTVPTASSTGTGTATPAGGGEAASGTPPGQLPRTGFDVIVSFELGLAMLLAGIVSHRMLALRERRDS